MQFMGQRATAGKQKKKKKQNVMLNTNIFNTNSPWSQSQNLVITHFSCCDLTLEILFDILSISSYFFVVVFFRHTHFEELVLLMCDVCYPLDFLVSDCGLVNSLVACFAQYYWKIFHVTYKIFFFQQIFFFFFSS